MKETAEDKIRDIVSNLDKVFRHQLPIEVDKLDPSLTIALYTKESNENPHYCINDLTQNVVNFRDKEVFCPSAYVLRLRALYENKGLEIFPDVPPEHIGFYRENMIRLLKSDMELVAMDCLAFSDITWQFYKLEKQKSLKLISYLVPMNASDIVSVASNFIPVRAD
ncbi:MAG: hypothetical protein PHD31_00225 [Candidatus Pacebacteria bacterium]|nr:hypothetical protein [Candidatus Paceibacterota bacterium]